MNKILNKSRLFLKHHSPSILTFAASAGVIATFVMAVKATPKAMKLLEEAQKEIAPNGPETRLTPVDVVKTTWKCYIPATSIGLSTILCIIGANALNKRKQASLASAYVMLDQAFKRYRKTAIALYGENADFKIKVRAAEEIYVSADGAHIYRPDLDTNEKKLFFDSYSQRYFTATEAAVLNAQYHLNRNFQLRGDISVNEFYRFLGIEEIASGEEVGWSWDDFMYFGLMWIDFENKYYEIYDGTPCCMISAQFEPRVLGRHDVYNEYYNPEEEPGYIPKGESQKA